MFFSSVYFNMEIKKQQQYIRMVLDGKKIPYTIVDISSDLEAKLKMREISGERSVPPQIANGDSYCGGFSEFEMAVEEGDLEGFLKL